MAVYAVLLYAVKTNAKNLTVCVVFNVFVYLSPTLSHNVYTVNLSIYHDKISVYLQRHPRAGNKVTLQVTAL